jgi:eukaryotic translation initiation factor 2C
VNLTGLIAYQLRIGDPNIPVINVGNLDHPMYLPAEVCSVVAGQSFKSGLEPRQTQNMIAYAVRRPWENANSITNDGLSTVGLISPGNQTMVRHQLIDWSTFADANRATLVYLYPQS